MPFLSIVTATYNRPELLVRLRDSIASQAGSERIEWIVADDGSTPSASEALERLAPCPGVALQIVRLVNGGKHRALNQVLERISGQLAVVIDDDDQLAPGALSELRACWSEEVAADASYLGVVGESVSGATDRRPLPPLRAATLRDLRFKHGMTSDKCYVLRGDIYRSLRFPDIPGEAFVAESSVWSTLYGRGLMLLCQAPLEIADYQADGLSSASRRLRAGNPVGATVVYARILAERPPGALAVRTLANYYRYALHACLKRRVAHSLAWQPPAWTRVLSWPLGAALFLVDLSLLEWMRPRAIPREP